MSLSRWSVLAALFLIELSFSAPSRAISLDPYPVYDSFHDDTSISFFREEHPSVFWVNTGVPDAFFNGVYQSSTNPTSEAYGVNGMEYGIRFSHWFDDHLRMTATVPYETNALALPTTQVNNGVTQVSAGVTQTLDRLGDIEVGATYLLVGQYQKGNFIGLDGWYRFATGTNPFTQTYPLLSSGRGASSEAWGVVMGQRLWNEFSFYENFHYETTQPLSISSNNTAGLPGGTFQWPDSAEFEGRIEWDLLQRSQRTFTLFAQYSMRMSGLMTLNGQALTYGQSFQFNSSGQLVPVGTTSQLFWDTGGMIIRVDKEFTAEVDVSYFPAYFLQQNQTIPNAGLLLSLSLIFRPF